MPVCALLCAASCCVPAMLFPARSGADDLRVRIENAGIRAVVGGGWSYDLTLWEVRDTRDRHDHDGQNEAAVGIVLVGTAISPEMALMPIELRFDSDGFGALLATWTARDDGMWHESVNGQSCTVERIGDRTSRIIFGDSATRIITTIEAGAAGFIHERFHHGGGAGGRALAAAVSQVLVGTVWQGGISLGMCRSNAVATCERVCPDGMLRTCIASFVWEASGACEWECMDYATCCPGVTDPNP